MPQMTDERVRARLSREEDLSLLHEVSVKTAGVSHLEMCIQCGTCGGSCPSAMDMEHTPRMLFAMLRAGMREEVLRSNTQWICVSCYHCVVRCPQEVHIADVMYTLKSMAIKAKLYSDSTAPSSCSQRCAAARKAAGWPVVKNLTRPVAGPSAAPADGTAFASRKRVWRATGAPVSRNRTSGPSNSRRCALAKG